MLRISDRCSVWFSFCFSVFLARHVIEKKRTYQILFIIYQDFLSVLMTLSHETCCFMYQLHHFLKGLRHHRQRTFVVMLSRFWLLRGWGSLSEAVKKRKILAKILLLFSELNIEWSCNKNADICCWCKG